MILEVADIRIQPGRQTEFDAAIQLGLTTVIAKAQGFSGFNVIAWNALYAPKGTPVEIVTSLNSAFNKVLQRPETRQRLLDLGFEAGGGTPEQLREFGQAERRKWQGVISSAGLKAE